MDRGVLHVEVVLAHEHGREVPDLGEVDGFVEGADVGGAVTEEGDGDLAGVVELGRPGSAVGHAEVGADDRIAAHHPVFDAGEVHRAALAAHQAVRPSQQLRHDRGERDAAGDRVGVPPVGGERPVVVAHGGSEAGGDGLLPERQVAGALHQSLEEQVVGALLEEPDLLLDLVHPDPDLGRDRQVGVRFVHRRWEDGTVVPVLLVRRHGGHGSLSTGWR